ncbi:unnamed protein product [Rotaria socialis]|uniref:Uncharacterized protein n=1 Tax=Rotaria socialis TaxID=392032 RepID=A0A821UDJ1_9BILA|nr:unnamed protein product [Rotaria socialis]CAF4888234.1 unnamed protein product [Rotaria socialis]
MKENHRSVPSISAQLPFRDRLCEKIKNLVALWAFQLIGCNTDNQDGNATQAEATTSTVDNVLLCTKDICDGGGLTPKRKSLFSYCEAPQN